MVVEEDLDPANARKALAEVGTQMLELASKSLARHVEYTFGDTLDIKMTYPGFGRNHLNILRSSDRIPAYLLLNTILNHNLAGYFTDKVTRAVVRGDCGYGTLDVLAVGDDEKANDFRHYIRNLMTDGNGKANLSLPNYSRTFEIRLPHTGESALSSDAVDNFILKVKPTWVYSGSSPIRLCVLTDEVYEEMQKPLIEKKESS